jgi:hypothetical protein
MRHIALAVALSAWFADWPARAEPPPQLDPYDVPPLTPRPPTLPELTHPDYEVSSETTVGVVAPSSTKATDHDTSDVAAIVQRVSAELPIDRRRRWFLGGSYEVAAGAPPGGGAFKLVPSNLDLYARTVWATHTGLTFGGGAGVLLPTAQFGRNDDAAKVAAAAQAVRPWDDAFFLDDEVTVRAFVDVRDVDGPFVVQFREGLEYSIDIQGQGNQVAAIAQAYIGLRVLHLVGLGLEGFETYVIQSPLVDTPSADGKRATFTLSPSVRLMTPYVQPVLGFVTSVGTPLFGAVDGFWALRFGASIVWDPVRNVVRKGGAVQ